jgi:branched-chain amino acid transport system permease protein
MTRHALALGFFCAAAIAPLPVRDAFLLDSLVLILMWGAVSGAWNLAGGYAGQVSLGHSAFFGIGAYAAALLATRFNQSPWLGMLAGAIVATAAGLVIGYLSNRLKGPYFALATIAFSQVLLIVASRWRGFTSGSEGIPVPFRPGFVTLGFTSKVAWVYVVLALALLVYFAERYLEDSRMGYRLAGVREDEDAAEALGIPSRRLKVLAIAVSAALTSACGTLWAQYVGFVDPFYVFSVDLSVRFALNAIIGGIGTAMGPFVGSILITALEIYLRASFSDVKAGLIGIYLVIYGCLLIVLVRFVPQGVVGWQGREPHRHVRRDPGHHRPQRRGQDDALQRDLRLLGSRGRPHRPRRARRHRARAPSHLRARVDAHLPAREALQPSVRPR